MAYDSLSSQQQELLDLLRNEIAEYVGNEPDDLWGTPQHWRDHFEYLNGQLEHLARAAQMIGLQGFGLSCLHLVKAFGCIAVLTALPPVDLQRLVARWSIVFLGYLQNILAAGFSATASAELLAYLRADHWPVHLSADELTAIAEAFNHSNIIVDDNPDDFYPEKITREHASLAIPKDVHLELLDGLMAEIPLQAESFSRAIDQYTQTGEASYLLAAQRVAHTIKGSGNVVGISGIANLMHYCEDLLEMHQKGGGLSGADFENLLLDIADGLANISEHLQGFAPEPDNIEYLLMIIIEVLKGHVDHYVPLDKPLTIPEPLGEGNEEALVDGSLGDELLLASNIWEDTQLTHDDILVDAEVQSAGIDDDIEALDTCDVSENDLKKDLILAPKTSMLETAFDAKPQFNLTIPDEKATELLRVTGEVQISNIQIQSRVDAALAVVESTLGFQQQLMDLATELEKNLAQQGAAFVAKNTGDDLQMDPLELERHHELYSFASRLQEAATDASEATHSTDRALADLQNIIVEQRQLGFEMQNQVLSFRLLPASVLSARFIRGVRQAARLTQKTAALNIIGDDVLVDSRVLNSIANPILHLLRNAVDHGLEDTAAQRKHKGKGEEGKITLAFKRVGDAIRVRVSDDGRGIDYLAIEKIAIERGILRAGETYSQSELNRVILMPGFSTRNTATQTSGRGIGLDVVHEQARELKGSLVVWSEPEQGTSFDLSIPMSVLSAHMLMVSCGQHRYGIISRGLQQIVYLQPDGLVRDGQKWQYELEGQSIDIFFLNHMVGVSDLATIDEADYTALLITEKVDGQLCGVAVENIIASEEHVIKPLGRFSYRPIGVTGAAILGSGIIAPVLNISDFPDLCFTEEEYARWQQRSTVLGMAKALNIAAKPIALVVDDSLSARRALSQFMSDFGYDVLAARDGFDAITQMADLPESRTPAIALLDLEMPRMNGLELAVHMRSQESYQHIPIAMITSRTTARHKIMAKSAGVGAYLNKPWSDDELTQVITELLPQENKVAAAMG